MGDLADHAQLDVVFVCTGNRFRSALAEALLRRATDGDPVRVRSTGVADLGPAPALPEALELGRALGVDLTTHRARCLRNERLEDADLVLGFELRHLAHAVVDAGARRDRAFTLPELVAHLDRVESPGSGTAVEQARRAIGEAAARRDREGVRLRPEIEDPLGGPPAGYQVAADTIARLVAALAERLFPR